MVYVLDLSDYSHDSHELRLDGLTFIGLDPNESIHQLVIKGIDAVSFKRDCKEIHKFCDQKNKNRQIQMDSYGFLFKNFVYFMFDVEEYGNFNSSTYDITFSYKGNNGSYRVKNINNPYFKFEVFQTRRKKLITILN